tara:strand:- start:1866 stop:2456 length:591 start_codon:yes stop_codon:yes gene_type:complete
MAKSGLKPFFILALLMAVMVAVSNFLVQFPFNYFGMEKILTYGAFSYPITFLITDLSNRRFGKSYAKKIVYIGFIFGVLLTVFFSTNFSDLISIRIAIGSGTAFLAAQLLDVQVFDKLRKKTWFIAPLASSSVGSLVDTFIFFFIAFYNTGSSWVYLAFGDFSVKILMALVMLIPFRLLLEKIKDITEYDQKASSV